MGNGILQKSDSEALDGAGLAVGREKTRSAVVVALAVTGAFLFCYAGVLASLVGQWWNSTVYSYGFLIPIISGYIVWQRREAIFTTSPLPACFSGGVLLLAGLFLFAFGHAGGILTLQQLSLMVTLMGLVLFFLGGAYFRRLALPIQYLWLMIPIWDLFTRHLHLPFQVLSANLGVMFLQQVGVPVYQEGLYIHLPNITLEVAEVCSGVNYLIAVIAIGIPLGYLFLHRWQTRIGLLVFGLVVSALSNSLRVGLIGVLSYYELSGDLHGPYHTLQGVFVSVIGYGALFAGLCFLARRQGPPPATPERTDRALASDSPRTGWLALPVCALFLVTGGYGYFFSPTPVPLAHDLSEWPMQMGEWRGREIAPNATFAHLGADRTLSRIYQNPAGDAVRLYIGYFESQTQGKELAGLATNDLDANATPVTLQMGSGAESPMAVNQHLWQKRGQGHLTLFWYDVGGKVLLDPKRVKLQTAWNALTRAETPGALIAVSTDMDDPRQIPKHVAAGEALIQHIRPLLHALLRAKTT